MKRALLLLLAACSSGVVREARINIPAAAHAVVREPLSFGPWHATSVREGATRFWLAEMGVLEIGRTDQAYRFALAGETGTTKVDCHTRELVVGRAGVFMQASLGRSPVLVCGLERNGLHSVLALTRTGSPDPSLRGELRQIGGTTYDVRSIHHPAGGGLSSGEPLGFDILRDESSLAMVETVNRGRVWVDADAPNREDLAAAAAALLLFRDVG